MHSAITFWTSLGVIFLTESWLNLSQKVIPFQDDCWIKFIWQYWIPVTDISRIGIIKQMFCTQRRSKVIQCELQGKIETFVKENNSNYSENIMHTRLVNDSKSFKGNESNLSEKSSNLDSENTFEKIIIHFLSSVENFLVFMFKRLSVNFNL